MIVLYNAYVYPYICLFIFIYMYSGATERDTSAYSTQSQLDLSYQRADHSSFLDTASSSTFQQLSGTGSFNAAQSPLFRSPSTFHQASGVGRSRSTRGSTGSSAYTGTTTNGYGGVCESGDASFTTDVERSVVKLPLKKTSQTRSQVPAQEQQQQQQQQQLEVSSEQSTKPVKVKEKEDNSRSRMRVSTAQVLPQINVSLLQYYIIILTHILTIHTYISL